MPLYMTRQKLIFTITVCELKERTDIKTGKIFSNESDGKNRNPKISSKNLAKEIYFNIIKLNNNGPNSSAKFANVRFI